MKNYGSVTNSVTVYNTRMHKSSNINAVAMHSSKLKWREENASEKPKKRLFNFILDARSIVRRHRNSPNGEYWQWPHLNLPNAIPKSIACQCPGPQTSQRPFSRNSITILNCLIFIRNWMYGHWAELLARARQKITSGIGYAIGFGDRYKNGE